MKFQEAEEAVKDGEGWLELRRVESSYGGIVYD